MDKHIVELTYIGLEERSFLIAELKKRYDLDLSQYSQASVSRRLTKLYNEFGADNAAAFLMKLEEHARPRDFFLEHFTVNVTEMFRDPGLFLQLKQEVFPKFQQKEQLRIWSAACSNGEEVLSLAILLHEAGLLERSEIFGTDISSAILDQARSARYRMRKFDGYEKAYQLAGGEAQFEDYINIQSDFAQVKPFLLERVQYAVHDLRDEPIRTDFDLILCRNVLIYFDKELQNTVLGNLYKALGESPSFLCLGSKESVIFYNHRERLREIDREYKIYQKS